MHAVAKNRPENEDKEIFLFKEGSVVAWNLSEAEVRSILQFVTPFETNRYEKVVVNDEMEVMPYMYSNNKYVLRRSSWYVLFIVILSSN